MEKSITGRMESMGKHMDELDQAIAELMDQAGLEAPPETDAASTKSSPQLDLPQAETNAKSQAVV